MNSGESEVANYELRQTINRTLTDLTRAATAEPHNQTNALTTALSTLTTIVKNIQKSKDDKYRQLNVYRRITAANASTATNAAAASASKLGLYERIGQFDSAIRLLRLIGFTEQPIDSTKPSGEKRLVLLPKAEDEFKIGIAIESLGMYHVFG